MDLHEDHDFFQWIGPDQKNKGLHFVKDPDRILDTNKITKFRKHILVEVCDLQEL